MIQINCKKYFANYCLTCYSVLDYDTDKTIKSIFANYGLKLDLESNKNALGIKDCLCLSVRETVGACCI